MKALIPNRLLFGWEREAVILRICHGLLLRAAREFSSERMLGFCFCQRLNFTEQTFHLFVLILLPLYGSMTFAIAAIVGASKSARRGMAS